MLPKLFYTITFSVSIAASATNLLLGSAIIVAVIVHHPCRTVRNLLLCNTAVATCVYSMFQIVLAGYGFDADLMKPPPACVFQAYFYTTVCVLVPVSYMMQSISRFFFAVLYTHKYLLGWKAHWCMIMTNYLYAFGASLLALSFDRGFEFEMESRLCLTTTKVFRASIHSISIAYLIPLTIIIMLYGGIVYRVRQSARRVLTLTTSDRATGANIAVTNTMTPNLRREMKLMRNIIILISILLFAGLPYLMMVLWHAFAKQPPPEPLYLLCLVNITLFFVVKMIVLLHMNLEVKTAVGELLRRIRLFR